MSSNVNTSVLKSVGFWAAVVSTVVGVLVSQHVVVDGSTLSNVFGWLLTIAGTIGGTAAGHVVGSTAADPTAKS